MLAAAEQLDIVGANVAVGGRVVEVDVHLAVVEEDKDEDEDGEEEDVDHDDPIDPTTSKPLLRSNPHSYLPLFQKARSFYVNQM